MQAVLKLIDLGILTEVERQGIRIFRATEVLRVTARPASVRRAVVDDYGSAKD